MASTEIPVSLGRCLVIGGCGFLGHHIVKQLLQDPTCDSVSVMSRDPTRNRFDKVKYFMGDITNHSDVQSIFESVKPDVVINTASPIAYLDHDIAPMNFTVNVDGNRHVLAAAKLVGSVKAYVYTSSGPIIAGRGGAYDHATEDFPTLATTGKGDAYHVAKAVADALVLSANDPDGLRTATIRPTAMYGEGDVQMLDDTMNVWKKGQTNVWMGYNDADMDVVYVGHVADAHVRAARCLLSARLGNNTPKVEGEAFNITDDSPCPPLTFFRKFWAEAGDKTPMSSVWLIPPFLVLLICDIADFCYWLFTFGNKRPPIFTRERFEFVLYTRTYSIDKARKRLGFKPFVNQDEAIKKTVKWYFEDREKNPNFTKYTAKH